MTTKKYTCLVCGRKFPEGQGIVIKYDEDLELTFHSSRCAAKFLKLLLERVPRDELKGYLKRIREELIEKIKLIEKARSKKI
ncbi:hypothetical protein J4526_02555 [Desulfurococcaceae archaeon MEX13E-LK6-19]|nr:hypothetical protein J4526_02555 [Desulfurococcaceae archaeon MEX13E-LK6-19]